MATFTLIAKVLKSQPSAAGDEVYLGGDVMDGQRMVGVFGSIMNTINTVTNIQNLDTSLFTLQLFFTHAAQPHGGSHPAPPSHNKGQAPETMVLEGANEFEGGQNQPQPRLTERAIGSVSAASPAFAHNIGKQFVLERQGQGQGQGLAQLRLTIA
jgi:hypothetical protein